MSSEREARDAGRKDGEAFGKYEQRDPTGLGTFIGEMASSSYRDDKDHPESYRQGFEQGRKDAYK